MCSIYISSKLKRRSYINSTHSTPILHIFAFFSVDTSARVVQVLTYAARILVLKNVSGPKNLGLLWSTYWYLIPEFRQLPKYVSDVTKHIMSRAVQSYAALISRYHLLNPSSNQELRARSVILHHFPNLNLFFKIRPSKPKPLISRRKYKQKLQE